MHCVLVREHKAARLKTKSKGRFSFNTTEARACLSLDGMKHAPVNLYCAHGRRHEACSSELVLCPWPQGKQPYASCTHSKRFWPYVSSAVCSGQVRGLLGGGQQDVWWRR